MNLINQKNSQGLAVALTIILEILFAFLGGWTLYDVFTSWGIIPAIIIGGLTGITLLLLYLYVFIYREYAIEAIQVFSFRRNESPRGRLAWATFLVFICVLMDSFFNANRMIGLPIHDMAAKGFIWAALQCFVFVPLALGKLVHAHVNVVDQTGERNRKLINAVDENLFNALNDVLPTLNASELLQLKSGNLQPLHDRMNAIESQRQSVTQQSQDPLAAALSQWVTTQTGAPKQSYADDLANSVGGGSANPLSQNSAHQNGHR